MQGPWSPYKILFIFSNEWNWKHKKPSVMSTILHPIDKRFYLRTYCRGSYTIPHRLRTPPLDQAPPKEQPGFVFESISSPTWSSVSSFVFLKRYAQEEEASCRWGWISVFSNPSLASFATTKRLATNGFTSWVRSGRTLGGGGSGASKGLDTSTRVSHTRTRASHTSIMSFLVVLKRDCK